MFIDKIRIKGFKSFMDETTLDFSELTGLWWVSGQIGAGKTTIGEAIIYGLYGSVSGKTNPSLISWGHKHGLVEIWCRSRNTNLYIKRELNAYGQSPMYVEVNGDPVVFTDKRTAQQQLEKEYLDAPRTMMELLCIISFGNFKSLSTLNAKDTKQFLDQVLGFDTITKYIEECRLYQATLRMENTQLLSQIRAAKNQIERMENFKFQDGNPEELRSSIAETKNKINALKKADSEALAPLQEQAADLARRITEVKTLGKVLRGEIDFIKKGVCPTCGASIDQSKLEGKECERKVMLEQFQYLTKQQSDLTAQISTKISESKKYMDELLSAVKSQENELIRLEEQSKHTKLNKREINKLKKDIANCEKRMAEVDGELSSCDRLQQFLQVQIRTTVLDSFIPALNMKIKELSGMLGLRHTAEFDSMFKCSIKSEGIDTIPISSLSTGQLKMVDMVIILAIIGSILSKISSNVVFLDELFSNLDPRTRSDLVGILRATFPTNSSILIVSHQDIDFGLFDGHIKTRLVPDGSGFDKTGINIERIR